MYNTILGYRVRVVHGLIVETIIVSAESENADLIAIASQGRSRAVCP